MVSTKPHGKYEPKDTKRPVRKAVVILGMHRSGTSALSNILVELGVDAPANLMSADENNPKGYFESMPLYLLHDELLSNAGTSWDDYRPIPEGWARSPKANEFQDRLKEVVKSEYGRSGFFLMKDPRVCRLVPQWVIILTDMEIEPLFVHTHRHPLEVASSLRKRNGFDIGYGYLVWLRHVLDAEAGGRGQRRSFTSYDRILADWPTETEKIAADLGISWPRFGSTLASNLNGILDPDLKRNTAGAGKSWASHIVPPQVRIVHDVLNRWAAQGEDLNDHAILDEIRRDFNKSIPLFQDIVHADGTRISAERDDARRQASETEARINEQSDRIAALSAENEALTEQIRLNHAALAQSEDEVAAIHSALQSMQNALEKAEAHRSTIIQEFELAKAQIARLQTQGSQV
ncbi:MAG: hypothetical protein U9R64_15535 [Pseudomonadota bacterium]|jgi:hypothetical protein|nr:hypothetical protein [Pseudomonadota bacterium]